MIQNYPNFRGSNLLFSKIEFLIFYFQIAKIASRILSYSTDLFINHFKTRSAKWKKNERIGRVSIFLSTPPQLRRFKFPAFRTLTNIKWAASADNVPHPSAHFFTIRVITNYLFVFRTYRLAQLVNGATLLRLNNSFLVKTAKWPLVVLDKNAI